MEVSTASAAISNTRFATSSLAPKLESYRLGRRGLPSMEPHRHRRHRAQVERTRMSRSVSGTRARRQCQIRQI